MRYVWILVLAVLLTASTCVGRERGEQQPGQDISIDGSARQPAIKEPPLEIPKPQIDILSPKLPASETEIARIWPAFIPPVDESKNWEFLTAAKSDDMKHAGKAYLTSDSTHKVLEIFRTTLIARGFGAQQVEDPEYFGRMDFFDGETAIVVCVRHDNEKGGNVVEITVHKR